MDSQISSGPDAEDKRDAEEVESEQTDAASRSDFEKRVRTLIARDAVEKMDTETVEANIDAIEDPEVCDRAAESATTPALSDAFEARAATLRDESPDTEAEADTPAEDTENDGTITPEEDAETKAEQTAEEVAETPEIESPFATDSDTESDDDTAEAPADAPSPVAGDGGESGEQEIDVKSITPDVLTVDEAAERDRRWSIEVWSEPGMGKTHFAMSAISPVVVIDTEGKADELAHKFRSEGEYDDPFILQPTDYDEAKDALTNAIKILDEFRRVEGVIGTIVVDSMSDMWEWAQAKYVDKFYPQADGPQDVDLKTGFGKGRSDWKPIKNYHNVKFRQPMLDSAYHLVWTAMSEDDYNAQLEDGDRDAKKAAGEKNNVYKADEVIRLREGTDGAPVAELQKSGKIKHRYTGLRYPTFEDHRQLVEAIDKAETGRGSVTAVQDRFNTRIVEGNPRYLREDDE